MAGSDEGWALVAGGDLCGAVARFRELGLLAEAEEVRRMLDVARLVDLAAIDALPRSDHPAWTTWRALLRARYAEADALIATGRLWEARERLRSVCMLSASQMCDRIQQVLALDMWEGAPPYLARWTRFLPGWGKLAELVEETTATVRTRIAAGDMAKAAAALRSLYNEEHAATCDRVAIAVTEGRLEDAMAEARTREAGWAGEAWRAWRLAVTQERTVVKLGEYGREFVSRSEARLLLAGREGFREVLVDFTGVAAIGQGFADELFRVWPSFHPEVRVIPEHMGPTVEFMVRRALGK